MRTPHTTVVVRKLGVRNWMMHIPNHFLVTDLPTKRHALHIGQELQGECDMGMQDNPLVGEYTKGISRGPEYFANLERRARREKAPIRPIVEDLSNPLFAMLRGPVNPLGLVRPKAQKVDPQATNLPKKEAEKPVDKLSKRSHKRDQKGWKKVALADLATAMAGTVFDGR